MAASSLPGVIKGVFIDTETGGLDPAIHGLTEVAAIAFTIKLAMFKAPTDVKASIEIHSRLQTFVKPLPWMAYAPGALAMQSYEGRTVTLEFLEAHGRPEIAVIGELQSFLHSHIYPSERYWNHQIWAQNADFDHGFLLAAQKRVGKEFPSTLKEVKDEELVRKGLTPYGHLQMLGERCDWSCTRKLFTKLGAMGIGKVNEQGKNISLKHAMPYYGITEAQTHSALQDCHDGIACLASMLQDEANYYRSLYATS